MCFETQIILKFNKDIMILDFFKIVADLKKTPRQGWIERLAIKDPESVADHSYSVAVMCMIISDLKGCDTEKMIKMALLHDLAESKIGDYTPTQISKTKKMRLEDDAFYEIMSHLPDAIQATYQKIWQEYQENNSNESKMLHQIDKLEMALQAKIYQKNTAAAAAAATITQHDIKTFLQTAKNEIKDSELRMILDAIEN